MELSAAQTSRSRVSRVEPCNIAANPPTMMNSISASQRRCRRRLRSVTELAPHPFEFKRKVQCFLVLKGSLLVAIGQARIHETQVETCFLGILDCRAGR
jgi:hypothetical protein